MTKTRILTSLAAVSALALTAACTDPAAVGGVDPNQRTKAGAVIGGLVGAGTGMIVSDNDTKGAIIGGVVGAGVGAAIGNILDKQAQDLQRDIGNSDVTVTNTGDRLIVNMPQDILFATDSATVYPSLRDELLAVANNLNRYPNSSVQVIGHTDNTGEAAYNQGLSERRAYSVQQVLLDGGVAPGRIQAIGRGENQPVSSNLTPEGRAQNRRVEIVIIPSSMG